MRVSVVIPSKNALTLSATLRSVAESAFRNPSDSVEVILVDASSVAPSVSSEISEKLDLRIVHKDLTLLEARVEGIRSARGDYVLNLDADQTLHPDLLGDLVHSSSNSVAIPERPTESGQWANLVHKTKAYELAQFRRSPNIGLPVIPRWYRRQPLERAISSLLGDAAKRSNGRLPTRHEDTILFWYFLSSNKWSPSECVGFTEYPIYHPVPTLPEVGRKYLRYGRDLGVESRMFRRGTLAIEPEAWKSVYRIDFVRWSRYWNRQLGWNLPGLLYDIYRGSFYGLGIMIGYGVRPSPLPSYFRQR